MLTEQAFKAFFPEFYDTVRYSGHARYVKYHKSLYLCENIRGKLTFSLVKG